MTQAEQTPTTTRRSFLSAAVAVAVLPANVAAQQDDPIFAIIESHRAALKEFADASVACDEVDAKQNRREITQSMEDWLDAAADANEEAAELLASTAPTTMAGLAAALAWLLEYDHGCNPQTTVQFLEKLVESSLLVQA